MRPSKLRRTSLNSDLLHQREDSQPESSSPVAVNQLETPQISKEALIHKLDIHIARRSFVELHTHLLGMGSADFWVKKIMETYILRANWEIENMLALKTERNVSCQFNEKYGSGVPQKC